MSDHATTAATDAFVAHRNLLFTVAYELLGSAADAEDVLQETWLRWVKVDLAQVRDPRAYLVRITARQSLNRLRTMARRKEAYVGPWLPEPLLTAPDVAEDVELAESVSLALLLVLETLSPTERAVFVLRDVFDLSYDEIAAAIEKSSAAVRQIAHRARQHIEDRRPRRAVSARQARAVVDAFQRAVATSDLQGLLDVLAPDVVLVGTGWGHRPVAGQARTRWLAVLRRLPQSRRCHHRDFTVVNGNPALLVHLDGSSTVCWRFRSRMRTSPASTTSAIRRSFPHRHGNTAHPALSSSRGQGWHPSRGAVGGTDPTPPVAAGRPGKR